MDSSTSKRQERSTSLKGICFPSHQQTRLLCPLENEHIRTCNLVLSLACQFSACNFLFLGLFYRDLQKHPFRPRSTVVLDAKLVIHHYCFLSSANRRRYQASGWDGTRPLGYCHHCVGISCLDPSLADLKMSDACKWRISCRWYSSTKAAVVSTTEVCCFSFPPRKLQISVACRENSEEQKIPIKMVFLTIMQTGFAIAFSEMFS